MLESYPATAAREEVDDVLQEFNLKLWSNLRNDPPPNVRVLFFRCAKLIRQTLIDMARKHRRREAEVAMPQPAGASSVAAWDPSDPTNAPHLLSKWGDLHEAIEHLPQELRETFDLLWYHGLTQGEAAAVLGVARETVNDRWRRARLDLHGVLGGDLPGM
jgi:RNA polymerase sigma-70 factor (ECF subfamily)